ncbi:MAG: alginate O-acetyltransferase AlgX-related protein [Chitinivibrionales bacterium]
MIGLKKLLWIVVSAACLVMASDMASGHIEETKNIVKEAQQRIDSVQVPKPYDELVHRFNPQKSRVMVRVIDNPTEANLDYAAYHANPILFEPQKFKPEKPEEPIALHGITFDSMLDETYNSIDKTPLTEQEKAQPMAWTPLNKKLWEVEKDQGFQTITSKINGYKWADSTIYMPYQQITAAYLHQSSTGPEIWVRVEFMPWVEFLDDVVSDSDGDSYREVYGKLNLEPIADATLPKAVAWIKNVYTRRTLNRQQVLDWVTALASYWYPTKNTDLVGVPENGVWPNKETEHYKKMKRTLKGKTLKNPLAVVKGRPFHAKGPIYNVFIVSGYGSPDKESAEQAGNASPEPENEALSNYAVNMQQEKEKELSVKTRMDTSISHNFIENNRRFSEEVEKHASYSQWVWRVDDFRRELTRYIKKLPQKQMGIEGKDGWLFFRKTLEYTVSEDLLTQKRDKNPLPHLKGFKEFLDSNGINFLFVPIPAKSEVYYEHLPVDSPEKEDAVVNPYVRKFLKKVQESGIEVIDLLPHFLDAKKKDGATGEPLYQRQDTHWTTRGLKIAAQLIAERIREYSWSGDPAYRRVYTLKDTTIMRQGDIVDKLPLDAQLNYPSVELEAKQVYTAENILNRGEKSAPIMVIGDSYTGVFEHIDCKGGGVGSHIAAQTGLPVDIITSWGGGPLVRQKMIRTRKESLKEKRLVVYIMSARDLYDYALSWETDSTE